METRHASVSKPKSLALEKMETLVRQMQSADSGVPVRCQKLFLTTIPSAFMGYDLIEWLMENLPIDDSGEALHLASLLCQHGYFFPVGDAKTLQVKDDSSLYRFQTPYYWPSRNHVPDSADYAIYLHKKIAKNKQKHGLEDCELEGYNQLKKTLASKWDFVVMQADEQLKMAKDRKKGDKIVSESQERAYWRVYRPPPGFTNTLEMPPVPDRSRPPAAGSCSTEALTKEVGFLRTSLGRLRIKISQVAESMISHYETYLELDPFLSPVQPSNPWLTDDPTFMELNEPLVEFPTERRIRRWAISMEETVSDPTGLHEFTACMRKEFSHENIRFWSAVHQLKKMPLSKVPDEVRSIYDEFLRPGAPCEINIDGKTMERTQELLKNPNRFTYDYAADHIFDLLLKKDCYPRFLRSEHYKNLLTNATNPTSKKSSTSSTKNRFFTFGAPGKKKISSVTPPNISQLAVSSGRLSSEEPPSAGQQPGSSRPDCDPPYRREEDAGIFLGGPATPPPTSRAPPLVSPSPSRPNPDSAPAPASSASSGALVPVSSSSSAVVPFSASVAGSALVPFSSPSPAPAAACPGSDPGPQAPAADGSSSSSSGSSSGGGGGGVTLSTAAAAAASSGLPADALAGAAATPADLTAGPAAGPAAGPTTGPVAGPAAGSAAAPAAGPAAGSLPAPTADSAPGSTGPVAEPPPDSASSVEGQQPSVTCSGAPQPCDGASPSDVKSGSVAADRPPSPAAGVQSQSDARLSEAAGTTGSTGAGAPTLATVAAEGSSPRQVQAALEDVGTPPRPEDSESASWPLAIAPPVMFQDPAAPLATIHERDEPTPPPPTTTATAAAETAAEMAATTAEVPPAAGAEAAAAPANRSGHTEIITLTDRCAQTVETGDSADYGSTTDKQCEANLPRERGTRRKEKRVKICEAPVAAVGSEPAAGVAAAEEAAKRRSRSASADAKRERKESRARREPRKKSSSERRRARLEDSELEGASPKQGASPKRGDVVAPTADLPAPQKLDESSVCPWENEENCRIDTPFVKTYATLGYL